MAHPQSIAAAIAVPQRRLTLTPIAFDLVLALSQAPDGVRLAELSRDID